MRSSRTSSATILSEEKKRKKTLKPLRDADHQILGDCGCVRGGIHDFISGFRFHGALVGGRRWRVGNTIMMGVHARM